MTDTGKSRECPAGQMDWADLVRGLNVRLSAETTHC